MVNFAGGDFYGADDPPKLEWFDDNKRLSYEERPRMILQLTLAGHSEWKPFDEISVFVNMGFKPTSKEIKEFIQRGLKAGGVTYEDVRNLRLTSWSGERNAFWHADMLWADRSKRQ